jgi:hypothetical protein
MSNNKISYKEIEALRSRHHRGQIERWELTNICIERDIDYSYLNKLLRENWQTSI